jgi:hypothetical protein
MTEDRMMSLRESFEELAELGSPVDFSLVDAGDRKLEIQQTGGVYNSMIFDLGSGRAGYMLDVTITNQTSENIYPIGLELRTPCEDDFFEWLTPLRFTIKCRKKRDFSYEAYRFPGKNGLELRCGEVLNHLLQEGKRLIPKRPFHGWLLATGGPMPTHLRHGQWLDASLAIIGSDHTEYTQRLHLWTERLTGKSRPRENKGSGIYATPAGSGVPDAARTPTLPQRPRVLSPLDA